MNMSSFDLKGYIYIPIYIFIYMHMRLCVCSTGARSPFSARLSPCCYCSWHLLPMEENSALHWVSRSQIWFYPTSEQISLCLGRMRAFCQCGFGLFCTNVMLALLSTKPFVIKCVCLPSWVIFPCAIPHWIEWNLYMHVFKQLAATVLIYAYSWFAQLCDLLVDMWESLHHLPICQVHSAPENYFPSAGTHRRALSWITVLMGGSHNLVKGW